MRTQVFKTQKGRSKTWTCWETSSRHFFWYFLWFNSYRTELLPLLSGRRADNGMHRAQAARTFLWLRWGGSRRKHTTEEVLLDCTPHLISAHEHFLGDIIILEQLKTAGSRKEEFKPYKEPPAFPLSTQKTGLPTLHSISSLSY